MNTLFCGIDLGTRVSSLCIMDANRKVMRSWEGKNSKMLDELRGYGGKMHCIVESAPLAESVCLGLESIGLTAEVVDSRHTKALLNGKKKTDKKPA